MAERNKLRELLRREEIEYIKRLSGEIVYSLLFQCKVLEEAAR